MTTSVHVIYHQEMDGWWADSPDVDGFVAVGSDLAEVRGLVREGIPFYLDTPEDEVDIQEVAPWGVGVLVSVRYDTLSWPQSSPNSIGLGGRVSASAALAG